MKQEFDLKLLIGGRWTAPASGQWLDSINPATEEVIARIGAGGPDDIDAAVAAARSAPKLPADRRAALILTLAGLIERDLETLAALETADSGTPLARTRGQIGGAAAILRYYAGLTSTLGPEERILGGTVSRDPVGVAALITPWNAPLAILSNKLGPALAAGCSVVIKPPELASLTTLRLGELVVEAGFPDGIINIVTGLGETAGRALAAHSGIDMVSFTGSTETGRALVHAAAADFKRLTLELGGKSPQIILADADLDRAIPAAAEAIFANSGQTCFAGSRLFVEAPVHDQVLAGIVRIAESLVPGERFGPLISERQRARVLAHIKTGIEDGATLVTGGAAIGTRGYYVAPTIFADVPADARIMREEIFGPVLVMNRFSDPDDAIRAANDTPYGLAAGIFTRDEARARAIAAQLRAGTVWINCYGVLDPAMPFGGLGHSGWGRELGPEGILPYLESRSVLMRG